ncbi:hypothetical protein EJ05DRAFT_495410 [Pseudovirgaria hyperparasitica]|uniref:MACPF domain-containing protein n=1 Tax=Pseudovirgaria hyperparasitica TaxID=470096 RepID=A0A6A6WK65_9PEZI|nr:uncharacterized protein EJ05DRAFT_495410 [Pseudovirgaria hyperparasitica]KAF2762531.1 hypothetical protein EJ05DRAFT_495410 [Pseudovirgaria hyperparasitica]
MAPLPSQPASAVELPNVQVAKEADKDAAVPATATPVATTGQETTSDSTEGGDLKTFKPEDTTTPSSRDESTSENKSDDATDKTPDQTPLKLDKDIASFFDNDFDVYLTELSVGDKKTEFLSSVLIQHDQLVSYARNAETTLRGLPLSAFRSKFAHGVFCLSNNDKAEISSHTTLADYVKRDNSAVKLGSGDSALHVFWRRKYSRDTSSRKADDVDIGLPAPVRVPLSTLNICTLENLLCPSPQTPDEKGKTGSGKKTAGEKGARDLDPAIGVEKFDAKAYRPACDLTEVEWNKVVEGNELLYGFQVNSVEVSRLRSINASSKAESKPSGGAPTDGSKDAVKDVSQPASPDGPEKQSKEETPTAKVTENFVTEAAAPVYRSTRPVFILRPDSGIGSTKRDSGADKHTHAGLFWSNSKALSTTNVAKTTSSEEKWSMESGMSTKSFKLGTSFPIKQVDVGAKFGFSRQKSHEESENHENSEAELVAVHIVPAAQVNINETTVKLSPDAEEDVAKLRKERRFEDLLSFYEKYGMMAFSTTTLGGRLFHSRKADTTSEADTKKDEENFKTGVNASLGIAKVFSIDGKFAKETKETTANGVSSSSTTEYIVWSSIGGNPGDTVNPPQWRRSLDDFRNWRPIKFENPQSLEVLIGRLDGYEDVPTLFSDILATGVLDSSIVAIPPIGLRSATPPQVKWPNTTGTPAPLTVPVELGTALDAKTGQIVGNIKMKNDVQTEYVSPEGFSWTVFSNHRDVEREIRAALQTTLNVKVNISIVPRYLNSLRVSETSFTIMLKWTSQTEEKRSDFESPANDIGNYAFVSVRSRSWLIGLWTVNSIKADQSDIFNELRLRTLRKFRSPCEIQEGCDFISEALDKSPNLSVSFSLLGSDRIKNNETVLQEMVSARRASTFLSRGLYLSPINMLPISGEVKTINKVDPPLQEAALMLATEAQVALLLLKVKIESTGGSLDTIQKLSNQLSASRSGSVFDKDKTFDVTLFSSIDKLDQDFGNDDDK